MCYAECFLNAFTHCHHSVVVHNQSLHESERGGREKKKRQKVGKARWWETCIIIIFTYNSVLFHLTSSQCTCNFIFYIFSFNFQVVGVGHIPNLHSGINAWKCKLILWFWLGTDSIIHLMSKVIHVHSTECLTDGITYFKGKKPCYYVLIISYCNNYTYNTRISWDW